MTLRKPKLENTNKKNNDQLQIENQQKDTTTFNNEKKDSETYIGEDLIKFVENQINKIKKIYTLGTSNLLTFDELNKALLDYFNIQLSLLSLHSQAKIEFQIAESEFNEWYAEKYMLVRADLNPRTISAQKWFSQKEIELEVINRYKEEHKKLKQKLFEAEAKLSFIRRLLESWTTQSYILSTLSKNLISEKVGSEVDTKIPNMLNKSLYEE